MEKRQKAAIAREPADSRICVGCTGIDHIRCVLIRPSSNCALEAALVGGNCSDMKPGPVGLPKQQPASKHPIRPKPSPIGMAKPAMSAARQNGKRSRLSKNQEPTDAKMSPP